ncbi:hypothetical protein DBR32_00090 [Taibaiella sp. KBW10]|uniref:hypothetical protein n=1 Tax=Taibaiella sp. KBW10 TaxID=2153357 RepID=UPI000F5B5953|nr:hypothetical protein [Taibaiella sp. KBW10]RQO32053.1 hypothetical protein DBR32_00090 [Taibaiella sp. KBW10]
MERRITEEQVTKAIIDWLETNGWEIICYDFPQSGTGVPLHLNQELRTTKNKGLFIPDIVAIKNGVVIFFENKDRFVLSDFQKIQMLKSTTNYEVSITKFLEGYNYSEIFYGVGLSHTSKTEQRTNEHLEKIDFAVFRYEDNTIKVNFDPHNIFSSSNDSNNIGPLAL